MTCGDCEQLRHYRAVARAAPTTISYFVGFDLVCHTAEGAAQLARLGLRREDIIGHVLADFVAPHNLPEATACVRRAFGGETCTIHHARAGREYAVQYAPARDEDGTIIGCVVLGRDVTDLLERERATARLHAEQLRELSLRDELTGLYNRRGFMELASQQLKIANRSGRAALLFFADVNGLKRVNDVLGHEAGDELIGVAACVLRATFREADVVARLGGDEFVALVPDMVAETAPAMRDRLHARCAAASDGRPWRLSVSLGWAAYRPDQPRELDALLAEADAAMFQAKRHRKATGRSGEMPAVSTHSEPQGLIFRRE